MKPRKYELTISIKADDTIATLMALRKILEWVKPSTLVEAGKGCGTFLSSQGADIAVHVQKQEQDADLSSLR